jgi:tetratricopeptide (TPR) repeat protein
MRLEHPERALRNIEKAIDLDSKNPWYLLFKAEVLEDTGKPELAARTYEQLVRLQPEEELYYQRWARALIQDEQPDEAIKVFSRLEDRTGLTEDIARKKHTLYLGMGNIRKARAELERLIETYPSNNDYRYLLAEFLEQSGKKDEAKEVYEEILALDPEDNRARLRLAGASSARDDRISFVESLQPIFEEEKLGIDPKIKRVIPLIQEVAEKNDPVLADALLDLMGTLKTVHPDEAKPYAAAGDLLYYTDRPEEALQEYLRALELDDTVFPVWEQVLTLYASQYRFEELADQAEYAMDIFPNQARLYLWSAMADIRMGKSSRAASTLNQAELMSSGNEALLLEVHYWQGISQSQQNNPEASEAAFQKALAIQPRSALVKSAYSLSLSENGLRPREALRLAEESLKDEPGLPQGLQAKGWYYYKQRQFSEAAQWLEQANEKLGAIDPILLEQLGDVYYQLGEVEQALDFWEKAKSLGSASDLLEKKIADRKLYE